MQEYLKILQFSLPIIFARLIFSLVLVVGSLILSSLGAEVLAANALATSISMGIFTFASGNLYGMSALIAKEYGQQKYAEVMQLVKAGFCYASMLGIILVAIFLNISWLLTIFHEPPQLIELLNQYFSYFAFSAIPMLWTIILQETLIACCKQKIIYIYGFIRAGLGIFMGYTLVVGKFGFPKLGFSGFGLSVTLSSLIGFCLLASYLYIKEYHLINQYVGGNILVTIAKIKNIAIFCVPIGIQLSLEILAIMVATLLLGHYGIVALAAQQITSQYLLLFTMVPFGIAHGTASYISRHMGNNKSYNHKYITHKGLHIVVVFTFLVGILYLFIPQILISAYLSKYTVYQVEIINLATKFFKLLVVYQLFDGIRILLSGVLRGLGNSITQMLIGVGFFWLLGMPLILVFMNTTNLRAIGVPLSLTMTIVICTITLIYYCRKRKYI